MTTSETPPLVALVPYDAADQVIATLKARDAYDDRRRIQPDREGYLAVPVREDDPPPGVEAIVPQSDPAYRTRDLVELLETRGWSGDALEDVPRSWAVIGSIIVGRFTDCPYATEVGEALLELHGGAHTVLDVKSITGVQRSPSVSVIAGRGETATVHREHGAEYALDLSEVMFAPGNQAERVHMGEVIHPEETVFDMFAGIGYFTIPMALGGATVIATEVNPTAVEYLEANVQRNGVSNHVDVRCGDCRDYGPARADRVVMGYYDATEYLETAVDAVRPGGLIHLHDVAERSDRWKPSITALSAVCTEQGRSCEVVERRTVKSHNPATVHVVIDAKIE